jgi:hypothetical protein
MTYLSGDVWLGVCTTGTCGSRIYHTDGRHKAYNNI